VFCFAASFIIANISPLTAHAGLSQSASAALARAVVDSPAIPDAFRCPRAPLSEPTGATEKKFRLVLFFVVNTALATDQLFHMQRRSLSAF
jgi:hypothetical protein